MCVGVDYKRQGLVMVEPDLVEGSQVQLMTRSLDFAYVHTETERLLADIAAQGRPRFWSSTSTAPAGPGPTPATTRKTPWKCRTPWLAFRC